MTKLPLPLKELLRRIEAKTEKTASCWLWQGYLHHRSPTMSVSANGRTYHVSVRRVLWISVNGEVPPGQRVTVSCGLDRCVHESHLCFQRPSQAFVDANRIALRARRSLTDEQARAVVQAYYAGETIQALADRTGYRWQLIAKILRGKSYQDATGLRTLPATYRRVTRMTSHGEAIGGVRLTWQEVLVAVGLWKAGYSQTCVAHNFGVYPRTIQAICAGENWAWLTGIGRPAVIEPTEADDAPHPDEALVYQHWKGGTAS